MMYYNVFQNLYLILKKKVKKLRKALKSDVY